MAMKNENGSELSLITVGMVIEGKLQASGSVRIDGQIKGDVVVTQNVSLGSSGNVEGNITAKGVTVGGTVHGTILAQEKLVLESKAVVRGDIKAVKLVIDEGALFDGRCMMSGAQKQAAPGLPETKSHPDSRTPPAA
jgi:cytoskeletal protein CcmA (bactofilin family)